MATPTFPNNWQYGDDGCCTNTISECVEGSGIPTFPNNWKYGDPLACINAIVECVPLFGDLLSQENFDLILQEDNVSEIALG